MSTSYPISPVTPEVPRQTPAAAPVHHHDDSQPQPPLPWSIVRLSLSTRVITAALISAALWVVVIWAVW